MSDTMSRLEAKIQEAVDTIEFYRIENSELKERNTTLEQQQSEWESKLTALIDKFEQFDGGSSTQGDTDSSEDEEGEESESISTSAYNSPSYGEQQN